ncbi:hypothetical protein [Guptibacillus algicola]|uniref:hypothetical protein n=1 Tax=Guptibacillus algicola TaxID=225844 RepID=UPI001CD3090A|nr:hypothetical protein [Alkalihalobacillus algicola]MCA0988413.1 hypothetical protein [Alkalihalobacillus algicola]
MKNNQPYIKRLSKRPRLAGDRSCSYRPDTGGESTSAGDCSRFCSSVCRRLFPLSFNQCVRDCQSCQTGLLFETDEEYLEDDDDDDDRDED